MLGAEGLNPKKEETVGGEEAREGKALEEAGEGKAREGKVVSQLDSRCKWTVGGIDRYVVEGEVMEEGGNRWDKDGHWSDICDSVMTDH